MAKRWLLLGSVGMLLAVVLGAFGAHGLSSRVTTELLAVYQTGVQYHFYHALGLLALGLFIQRQGGAKTVWLTAAGWLMVAGIVIFSGSLYLLTLTGSRWLGAITPIGGLAFIGAWLAVIVGVYRES